MTDPTPKPAWYRQIRWKLTLSYSLVLYFALIVAESLFVVVTTVYSSYINPDSSSFQIFVAKMQTLLADDIFFLPIVLLLGHLISRRFSLRLERLVQAVDVWARGSFDVRPHDDSPDEIGILTRRLQVMADQLQQTVATEQALAAARERDRMARDLHDTVKQQVFAIQMELTAARNLLDPDPKAAAQRLTEAIDHTRHVQHDLNSLIKQAAPAGLEHKTLGIALREYIGQVDMLGTDLTLHVTGDRDLPLEIEEELFRMVQGALANVAKHSQADVARIELEINTAEILVRVADNGVGFDVYGPSMHGFGLESMRTRVAKIGGGMEINSQPGAGTVLKMRVPLTTDG